MAQLAIKGHPTRGKEVIEILEMLGGENKYQVTANRETYVYFVDGDTISFLQINQLLPEQFIVFALEEFLEKYPYKVGDWVQHNGETSCGSVFEIEKIQWEGENVKYIVKQLGCCGYGKKIKITAEHLQHYKETYKEGEKKSLLASLIEHFRTTPKDELEREWNEHNELDEIGPTVEEYIAFVESIKKQPNYKKQPHYPKTYEECCKILMGKTDFQDYSLVLTKLSTNKNEENSISPEPPHITLINNFYKLLICRDAYWKISGEQMGLGKPWEPDWDSLDKKYDIYNYRGVIKYDSFTVRDRCLLGFPTQEMRDAFYENFKNLIEECKELL